MNMLMTCNVQLDNNLDDIAHAVSAEVKARVARKEAIRFIQDFENKLYPPETTLAANSVGDMGQFDAEKVVFQGMYVIRVGYVIYSMKQYNVFSICSSLHSYTVNGQLFFSCTHTSPANTAGAARAVSTGIKEVLKAMTSGSVDMEQAIDITTHIYKD